MHTVEEFPSKMYEDLLEQTCDGGTGWKQHVFSRRGRHTISKINPKRKHSVIWPIGWTLQC
jgi:hypothetical protein